MGSRTSDFGLRTSGLRTSDFGLQNKSPSVKNQSVNFFSHFDDGDFRVCLCVLLVSSLVFLCRCYNAILFVYFLDLYFLDFIFNSRNSGYEVELHPNASSSHWFVSCLYYYIFSRYAFIFQGILLSYTALIHHSVAGIWKVICIYVIQ